MFPLFLSTGSAGFPSSLNNDTLKNLNLNELLVKHPAATFFVKVKGEPMINAGIYDDDILVVDRSLNAIDENVVVAIVNNEFVVKRFRRIKNKVLLFPENPLFKAVKISPEDDFEIWGVVTYVIHKL